MSFNPGDLVKHITSGERGVFLWISQRKMEGGVPEYSRISTDFNGTIEIPSICLEKVEEDQ